MHHIQGISNIYHIIYLVEKWLQVIVGLCALLLHDYCAIFQLHYCKIPVYSDIALLHHPLGITHNAALSIKCYKYLRL